MRELLRNYRSTTGQEIGLLAFLSRSPIVREGYGFTDRQPIVSELHHDCVASVHGSVYVESFEAKTQNFAIRLAEVHSSRI